MKIGNLGEAKVLAKFTELGIQCYLPFGDGNTVDLIAEFNNKLNRIQVKSTEKDENGSLPFSICSTTIRTNGEIHKHFYTEDEIDYYALYSYVTDEIYLLSVKDAPNRKVTIRYKEPYASNSKKAKDYLIDTVISNL